ncbi:MAG TPA: ABC transporter permease [Bacillus bacterium]|uniref:ABC transporter permease n=1 Tax=Siminovitchia fordii TaxID=254759 RepID=A0ABQ4JZ85_9BACI|nr:ABC transporter permease [Siminovitchia fordii]GIN18877.1 hypothetical protein J1TS3_00110 [Siminovitchia fordii]HBZ10505.1 ABC transporter permease [Bacillus sp. (in: firmicutes)]
MKTIIATEWQKLWKRKIPWLLLAVIPVMVYAAAKFCQQQNRALTPDLPQYTVAGNFPILGLSEMLMTVFNLVATIIAALIVTEEYRSGSLRMVLMRIKSFQQLVFAKYLVLISYLFVYLLVYFLVCYGIGLAMFSCPDTYPQFYHQDPVTWSDGFLYNLKFYALAFLTLIAISSVILFFTAISQTMTTALGVSVGYLLICFAYPNFIQLFSSIAGNEKMINIFFTSIPMIQWEGITMMLAETPYLLGWMLLILISYFILFQLLLLFVTRKKDMFI